MTQPKLNSLGLMAALFATATWGLVGVFIRWLPGWSSFTDRGIAPKSINIVFMTCLLGGIISLLCTIFFTKLSLETGIDR